MIILSGANAKLQVVTGSAASVEVHASYADNNAGSITPGFTNTAAIASATTTDVVAAVGASKQRKLKFMSARNDHASTSTTLEVLHNDSGSSTETLWKGTLLAGEQVYYNENVGWVYLDANGAVKPSTAKLDSWLRVVSDVINATTSFADITGLTVALLSGKKYMFEAHLYHVNDATTTGSRFGYNIGAAPTASIVGTIDTVTPSVTASAHSAGVITARDTAVTAQTTGSASQRLAIISGFIQPSADGTFAMRCASEVAVAAGLTVKAGSWLHVRELDN